MKQPKGILYRKKGFWGYNPEIPRSEIYGNIKNLRQLQRHKHPRLGIYQPPLGPRPNRGWRVRNPIISKVYP